MKLLQQIVFENDICNGAPKHSPMLVDLTLQEIISAGKVTNQYQNFVLGHLAGFFKNGLKSVDLHLEGPISYNTDATSEATRIVIDSLSAEEQVYLATYLLDCIVAGECMLYDKSATIEEWIRFVLQKQA